MSEKIKFEVERWCDYETGRDRYHVVLSTKDGEARVRARMRGIAAPSVAQAVCDLADALDKLLVSETRG